MIKCTKLFWIYFGLHMKSMLMYRDDFIFSFLSDVIWSIAGLLIMIGVFGSGAGILNYTYNEITFIYGYSLTSLGIYYIFLRNVSSLSEKYIFNGELERLIIRPINTFFQVILEKFSVDKAGDLVVGIVLMIISASKLNILRNYFDIVVLIFLLICSSLIYMEINCIYSVCSFWIEDRYGLSDCLDSFRIFVKYPIDIYNNGIRLILTFILPYAFTSYYPSMVFINGQKKYIIITLIVTVVFAIILNMLWTMGIRRYSSVGN